MEIFDCKAIDILLEFKWIQYAWKVHMFGFVTHVIYVLFFSAYVSTRFVYYNDTYNQYIVPVMAITLFYPLIYDMT